MLLSMDVPDKFQFPFEPYPIQEHFMRELYLTLKNNKLGIFESPTGTGKSLSICCGALTWLKDYEASKISDLENNIKQLKIEIDNIKYDDDWLQEEHEKIVKNLEINKSLSMLDSIRKKNEKLNELRLGKAKQKMLKGDVEDRLWIQRKVPLKEDQTVNIDSEDDTLTDEKAKGDDLMLVEEKECETDDETEEFSNETEACTPVQIYFGSRTHSQLSQFLSEIKRSPHSDVRAVTLASRRHYCINPEVQKLKNIHLMDEKCMELRKAKQSCSTQKDANGIATKKRKTKSSTCCQYYNASGIETLRDIALGEILDVEELANMGKLAKGCPYYAARAATRDAQLVLLPHTSVLTSQSLPKEAVLILDEAHNLGGALSSAYTVTISLSALTKSKSSLSAYISRYKDRFASKTLLKLNQIFFIVNRLIGLLQPLPNNKEEILIPFDFIVKAQIDHLNISPLVKFAHDSKLPQKLHWFGVRRKTIEQNEKIPETSADSLRNFLTSMSHSQNTSKESIASQTAKDEIEIKNNQDETSEYSGNPIYSLLRFLELVSTSTDDGRVCIQHDTKPFLKYLLLDPTKRFSPIALAAKSIILAGGTMQPDWEFSRLLLSGGAGEERLSKVSCDHVVDPEHVKAIILHSGPGGKTLKVTHSTRTDPTILDEIGRVVQNLCRIVPGGIICFLSSYGYEEVFHNHLQKSGILAQISKIKTVFREPKDAKHIDKLLDSYNKAIKDCNRESGKTGALLLSVVGGKLSEGLNFSDDLGRCVVVIGLPYGDKRSVEEKARWDYLDRHVLKGAGNANYQANCMKQVNQCIGRAVRHVNDWAAMILLDERYSQQGVVDQLPLWIQKSLEFHQKFAPAYGSLAKFYKKHGKK